MPANASDLLLQGRLKCPNCGAEQAPSDECRRCRADLSMLRQVARSWQATRRRCLLALGEGRDREALAAAKALYAILPDASARRLLAVCHLRNGDCAAAWEAAQDRSGR